VVAAVAVPVDEAGDALRGEFTVRKIGQGAEMNVGNMREFEHNLYLAHIPGKGNHAMRFILRMTLMKGTGSA
jgi:hypothetical protein